MKMTIIPTENNMIYGNHDIQNWINHLQLDRKEFQRLYGSQSELYYRGSGKVLATAKTREEKRRISYGKDDVSLYWRLHEMSKIAAEIQKACPQFRNARNL